MLLLCASAWGLGLAGACLRLGAVRYFVSRLFDKFREVLFVMFCVHVSSPHLSCAVNKYWFELSHPTYNIFSHYN